jgi:hypothetical protein
LFNFPFPTINAEIIDNNGLSFNIIVTRKRFFIAIKFFRHGAAEKKCAEQRYVMACDEKQI